MNQPTESQIQQAAFEYFNLNKKKYPEYHFIVATPNQGFLGGKIWGSKRKKEGLSKGFPDISVLIPKNGYAGFFLELKIGKNKPSKEQIFWVKKLNAVGYLACVFYARSWVELVNEINKYLKIKEI